MSLVADFQGPRRGVDRAVLLAHGAGADRNARALTVVADALADAGIPSLRFDYPYRTAGRKAPDRAPVLEAATREAAATLARTAGLPPERLVLGGRSMGGRYCSMMVASPDAPVPPAPSVDAASGVSSGVDRSGRSTPALGLLLLGYPLQAMGRPERRRDEHFGWLRCPVLFVSGTRDSLAPRDALTESARAIPGPVSFAWIETADHGFRPLKRSGMTIDEALASVAETCVTWVRALGAAQENTA
jgi:hypothetical protein